MSDETISDPVIAEAQDLAVQQPVVPATNPVVEKEDGNVAVTALVPADMQVCQSALVQWAAHKLTVMIAEAKELQEAYEHAKQRKWKSDVLKRQAVKAQKRVEFYEKMKAALELGYVIVPNFPVQLFLIRTNKENPLRMVTYSGWRQDLKQKAEILPHGEGEYQNPFPLVKSYKERDHSKDDPNATRTVQYAEEWDDIEFPVTMAKPEIMEAVSRAQALNLFDQIGVLPHARKEDPIIIGQLIDPRDNWKSKVVSFMIAWHLDTRVL